MKSILELAEEALDAAGVKHDGIDREGAEYGVIYVDAWPQAALVITPEHTQDGKQVRIELNTWDASGGLDVELWVANVRPSQTGVVVEHWLKERKDEEW
jgi:hypothetical protein